MKKLFITFALAFTVLAASAQVATLYQPLGTNLTIDTVTNTGTAYLTSRLNGSSPAANQAAYTTIQVVVTKISGTVGGTISLQGSIDGTNFKALNTAETQTALATITATDASNVYHWRLNGSPFLYYRVSWTGTGTMAASFSAKIYRAK